MLYVIALFFLFIQADPVPTGGANCSDNLGCGGTDAGNCINQTCVCKPKFADIDCSYERRNGNLAGGLNIGLPFVGIAGIGNFIIGRTGPAVGQLILMLTTYLIAIPACCIACCIGLGGSKTKIIGGSIVFVLLCVALCAILAGFIWSIVDGAYMIQGKLVDGNGFSLYRG